MERHELLERKIEILEWLHTLMLAANKATSYENVIQQCLDKICIPMQFSLGHAYFYNSASNQLEPSKIWSFPQKNLYEAFVSHRNSQNFDYGQELPGQVLQTKKAIWIQSPEKIQSIFSEKVLADFDIKTAFAFPVFIEGQVSIVLEFFHIECLEPNLALIAIAENLSAQLGYVLHRHQLEMNLQNALDEAKKIPSTNERILEPRPRAFNELEPALIEKTQDSIDHTPVFKGKILVVEDVKANQFVLKRMLEKLGCVATVVNNGKESCDLLSQFKDQQGHPFDLIFMDCHMAVMDGFEATDCIRKMSSFGAHVPIIALTSGLLEEDQERCLAIGMNDILKKPIRKQDVADILTRWKLDTSH